MRLEDEINQLKKELDETLKCLEHEDSTCTSTEKGKQRLKEKILEIKRALWGKVRDLEWFLEEKRVRACVIKAEEQGIIVKPKPVECPICFDDIPIWKMATYSCCGKVICVPCMDVMKEKRLEAITRGDKAEERQFLSCPCCRETIPDSFEHCAKRRIKRAEKGCSESQFTLGEQYEHGKGVNVDLHTAVFWYRRSAEQGHTMAQHAMGRFHGCGLGGCDQCYPTAEIFFTLAAAKNHPAAQYLLAELMNESGRYAEALQWATLSAAQDDTNTDGKVESVLASLYDDKGAEGITKSCARALYWAKKAAMAGHKAAFVVVADLIVADFIMEEEVGSHYEVLYWLRKGTLLGSELANKKKTMFEETILRSFCSGCSEPASSFPGELKKCNRCLAANYCSKTCQVDHWTREHKLFCCDKKGKPRFSVFPDCDWEDICQISR